MIKTFDEFKKEVKTYQELTQHLTDIQNNLYPDDDEIKQPLSLIFNACITGKDHCTMTKHICTDQAAEKLKTMGFPITNTFCGKVPVYEVHFTET